MTHTTNPATDFTGTRRAVARLHTDHDASELDALVQRDSPARCGRTLGPCRLR